MLRDLGWRKWRAPDRTRRRAAGWMACALVLTMAGVAAVPAAAAAAADPLKVLRTAIPVAETGFDPQATSDLYSTHVQRAIFDTLYEWDYLARPYRLAPSLAVAMPEITADGRTWTMRLQRGVRFADDAAFKGRPRELTADDVVFSWKRLLDPRMRSPYLWYLEGKLVGADAVLERAKKTGRLDYDAPIPGLRALDRYTVRLELKQPEPTLLTYIAHNAMSIVAREVIEAYGDASGWAMANPVGTGAYRLAQWRRGQLIVLAANPGYRDERYPRGGAADASMASLEGRRVPLVSRVEINVIEESNPRLLAFNSGALDYVNVPSELSDAVIADGALKPGAVGARVRLESVVQPALQYAYFNMEDPVVGGYGRERIALRRAIVMAFDRPALIRTVYQNQALPATQPVPPGVAGHDPNLDVRLKHDPAAARALLDRFGYVDRDGDGWRDLPDGKPLALSMGSATSGRDREFDEIWKRSMSEVGIRIDFVKQKWPDLLKMARAGQLQMWRVGWITQTGDGDAFVQLLYGPNSGQSNMARFSLPEYDALYRESKTLPDGPKRTVLFRRMAEIAAAYNPWDIGVYTMENTIVQPWVRGYRKHAYWEHPWKYLDVDPARALPK